MQGHNKSILKTGYQFGDPKNVLKKSSVVLGIYMIRSILPLPIEKETNEVLGFFQRKQTCIFICLYVNVDS